MFKSFLSGFFSVFKPEPLEIPKEFDIACYFYQIESDINKLYQELIRDEGK